MSSPTRPGRAQSGRARPDERGPLSRDRILRAGVELADAGGLDGLSMRKLAGHLGFEVMSLYNHVRNKEDLLEGMLDLVGAEVELPEAGSVDWQDGLRTIAVSSHRMLLRHRWAGPLLPTHFPGTNRWRTAEAILGFLRAGELDGHLLDVGYHAITLHISGFTAQQIAYDGTDEFQARMFGRLADEFSPEQFPLMDDHIRYHTDPSRVPGERPDEFRFVLDLILDGLARARRPIAT